ncbi:hypothetical protein AGMMS49593_01510 [Endomicrobiia bacterium]|nr:hypothetical protein AGMMS49593_01510 [Endomicrobiia bacterium]
MKKTNTIFSLFINYKIEVIQYLCIDFLQKFVNIVSKFLFVIFIDTVNISNNFILIFVILYISVLIFSSISVLFKTLTLYLLENKVLFDFRRTILTKFLNSRYKCYSNLNKGSYLSQRIINDTDLVNSLFIGPIASSISSIFFLVCLLPIFLQFNLLTILLPTLSAVLPFLFLSFFNKKNRYFTSQYQEKFALYSSKLSDTIDSIREIKLFDIYKKETDKIDSEVKDLVEINTRMAFWGYTSGQFSVALQHIVIGVLFGFLGYQVQQKIITLGQAVFICSISTHLFSVVGDFWSLYFSTKTLMFLGKELKEYCLESLKRKILKIIALKKLTV